MNRIYRSIWNQATGAYAAVSENVKSAGKRSMPGCSGGGAHFALTSMAAALMLGYGSLALAGPAGGTVVAGQASITGAPGSTVINQGSQNAVINWASFNVGKGESVQFVQPNSNAVALNRVLGSDGTTILGNLSANGKVFIVNPNGVLFGQGASVNTAGLVASTLDISNADFMAGKYQFSGNGTGKVLNQGSISAPGGYVALLGANVSNEGTIQARLGSVALAAGRAITLDVAGDGLLNVAVNAGAVGALVSNGGMIRADGGSVVLTAQAAGDLLKTVVNNTGVIEAQTIDTRSGTIKLLGDMQSGTVNAGGTLDASAPTGGKGGFIDTSAAHVKIDDALKVTTAAPRGLAGTWLIDPTDFNIAVSGGDMTGAFLSNSLKSGNVQIQSVSGGSGTQGNINVNDNINWIANKLTLTAQNNININKAMRGAGTASLALEYGQSGVAAGNLATYNVKAEVDLPSGNNFSTKLGSDGGVTVYQVINSLGAFNSTTGNDVQGLEGNLSGNYVLGSNIDARATGSWESGKGFMPIGNDTTPFTGTLDGLGHEIIGLTINRPEMAIGMFGNIGTGGAVRNMGLGNVSVAGSVAAYASSSYAGIGALAAVNNGKIDNVYSSGAVHGSGYINMGALVGTNAGTISNSRAAGTVVAGGFGAAGGLVGENAAGGFIKNSSSAVAATSTNYFAGGLAVYNRGTISDSYATGAVSVGGTGGSYGGGLAAINTGEGTVTNSYATGNVTGASGLGGLLGRIESGAVTNSYATGNVTGTNNLGGLVGVSAGPISNSYATGNVTGNSTVGGVVGYNIGVALTNAYYSGKLTTTGINNGAIVGDHNGGSIVNAYFDSSLNPGLTAVGVASIDASTIAQGLSAAQMLVRSNYVGFNFTTTAGAAGNNWVVVSGDGSINGASAGTRPMLASEWSNTINSTHQLQLMAMSKAASYTLGSSFSAASTAANGNDVWGSTGFIPVGTAGSAFTGSLDGTGHIVSNLNIIKSGVAGVGLFGVVGSGGVIANVGLSGGTISGGDNTGALVGTNGGSVSGSFATSAVTGANNVGGLVGSNTGTGTIKDSYASGAVTGSSGAGGLVGSNSGTLATSYANGSVSGAGGGLVGTGTGSVTGSYWDSTASGKATSAGGTDLTTSGLKTLSNYTGAGWDLGQMWVAYDGQSAPFLRSFMQQIAVRVSYDSKVYDGVAYAGGSNSVTYSNTVAGADLLGTLVYAGNATGAVNAGTYGVSASGLYATGGQSGYAISYIDGGLVITQRQLSLNGAGAGNKVYDGNTTAIISGGTLAGLLAGDLGNVNLLSLLGTYASKNVGNGIAVNATATLGGSAAGNYILAPLTGVSGNITPATISSISGILAGSKVYDGLTGAALDTSAAVLAGKIGSDALTLSGTGTFDNKNAGSGKTVSISGLFLGGADAGNYILAGTTGSALADITAKALTITDVTTSNRVYDGTRNAALSGGTLSGLVGGETLGLSGLSGVFDDKNVGTGKSVTVSGATLADGTGLASNYTVSNPGTLTADISKATISSVTNITANSKVYDANTKASINAGGATFNGMFSGDSLSFSATTAAFSDKNVGSGKTVAVSGIALAGTDAGNYNLTLSTGSGSGDITPKALTITGMSAVNKVYDGSTKATLSGGSISGLVGSETLGVTGLSASFSDKNAGAGKTVIASGSTLVNGGNGGLASNYTISNPSGLSANITPKALTVTGMTASNKVYDGLLDATLSGGSLSGLVSGETLLLSGATGVFSDKNAGSNKTIVVSGSSLADGTGLASNYTVSNPTTVKAGITQKALTVSGVLASDKTYDGNTKASLSGGTLDGLVGGETLGLTGQVGSFSDQNAGAGKSVTVSGATLLDGTGLASNYSVSNATGVTATIAQKALTVSGVSASNRVYDGTLDATLSGGTLSGLVGGETLGLSGLSGVFGDKNVGTGKSVTVSGATLADGTGLASNYTVSNPGTLTADISKATISSVTNITANSKVYDANTKASINAGGATFNGMFSGDSLSFSATTAAFSDKNVGSGKTVAVSGIALAGTDAGNYNLTLSTGSGSGDITPKALTITGMSAVNKVYDGSTKATLSGGSISGLVGSETLGVTGLSASFSDKNAGAGKTVIASGSTLVNGGNGGLASNYTISNPSGLSANITPKALTVTGMTASNKVYDGLLDATLSGGSLSGLVSGETLLLSGATGVFSDKNAGSNKTIVVSGSSLADGTGLASNYTVSNPTTVKAGITQKALTVSGVLASDKTYDGNTKASLSGGTLDGLVGGETLGLTGQVGSFSDQNAGTGKAVAVTGATLIDGTGLASNYSVSNATGVTATIAQKALSVSGVSASSRVYDGTLDAVLSGGVLSGLVGMETLSLNLANQTGAFSDKNAGSNKVVNVTGATVTDGTGLASNYAFSNASGVTATITPKALTVTGVTAASRDYDGTQQAALSGGVLSGLVGMETLSLNLANQTGAFSDKNAGSNKVVNVTGATVSDGTGLASNYAFSNASGVTATITPKALTVTGVTAASRDYDGTQQAALSGGVLSGLVGMETLSLNLANQTGAFSDKNAGSNKVVNVTGATVSDGTGLVSNYAFSNASGVRADIGKASISAIAGIVAANKVYDGGTAASLNLAGATFNGMVAGDVLSLGSGPVLGAFSDKNAALGKTVAISGLGLAGADAGNYVLASSQASTTADITPATLTVSASGVNKVYDATTNAAVSLRDNRIGNDQLSIASNGASFSDKNAGAGKTVTVAGISLSGTDAGNYVVNTSASTTATISQAALTVKVDNSEKDQGRVNPDFSAGYSGLLGGDTVAAEVSGNLAFSTPATTASAAGNYLVSASGQASNNYALNYVEGVLKVKPTEALQSAVASVIAAVAVAPSQGNMVQADMIVSGESAPGTPAATQEAPREGDTGNAGSAPVVQLASNVVSNVLPGLRLSVVDSGLRLPTEAGGNTRQESQ
ncbi:YDG domain-containing protein [Janthinobacterium tructae]|uniref:YDG domain-containing protein n=1 Tax=Janthinobacterium tructae TaxID=2590869 RepID=UPI00249AEBD2|nr:YDG domain-containing protein [Janthinobacterium tructae]MDI3297484.1 YDG domain-containing protein [Janthinobacterium tructae]